MSQLVQTDISQYKHTTEEVQSQSHGIIQTILSLIPTNIISSMAHGEMLPVIFFAVLFGIGLSSLPATTKDPLLNVFHAVSETMFRVTHHHEICASGCIWLNRCNCCKLRFCFAYSIG